MLVLAWRNKQGRNFYLAAFFLTLVITGFLAANKSRLVGEDGLSIFTVFNMLVDYSFIGCIALLIALVAVAQRGTAR